jgi:hypothetical protein
VVDVSLATRTNNAPSGASNKSHDVERRFEGEECVDLGRSGGREKLVGGGANPIPTDSAQEFRQVVGVVDLVGITDERCGWRLLGIGRRLSQLLTQPLDFIRLPGQYSIPVRQFELRSFKLVLDFLVVFRTFRVAVAILGTGARGISLTRGAS